MRVLVIGASGYVGREVATALRRRGHEVYGTVRSAAKAKVLEELEIRTILADASNLTSSVTNIARRCGAIIHCAADYANFVEVDSKVVDFVLGLEYETRPLFVYTSGCLVYGQTGKIFREEDACNPHPMLVPRHNNELRVMKSNNVFGVVTRPSFVFGKTNVGHFNNYFKQAELGNVSVKLPNITWSQVHVDDLAEGYVKIVESPHASVGGLVFNFSNQSEYTNRMIAERFAKFVNPKVVVQDDPSTDSIWPPFLSSSRVDSSRARNMLDWVPRHAPLLDEVEVHYATYKAIAK